MLELKNIHLKMEKEQKIIEILTDINFTFESGKTYVITGPNGSGKSSLAKTIMGIYHQSEGQIFLDQEEITEFGITEKAKAGIGYAFQQPARFKGLKVREILNLALARDKKENVSLCDLLLDVGLCPQDYLEREMDNSLSGGELKRIEIATVLGRKLKMALFDEPEAGIDLWSFQKLVETFQKMHQSHRMTLIIISHQERIMELADQIITMDGGLIKKVSTKEEFFAEINEHENNGRCLKTCDKGGHTDVECN